MPAGLPPCPGDGWEPDTPVPTPVVQRAVALLPQLWAQGEGSHQPEMTAGHWVMYLAQMLNGKHGVTAWRVKKGAAPVAPTVRKPSSVPFAPAPSLATPATPVAPVAPGSPLVQPAVYVQQPAATPSVDDKHAVAIQMRDDLNAHGYKKSSQPLYRRFELAIGAKQDGYPGSDDMAQLRTLLADLGLAMPNVPIYPWKASGGWKHPNAPTQAEWNR